MKVLISAFALLAFLAATTLPAISPARAETQGNATQTTAPKKTKATTTQTKKPTSKTATKSKTTKTTKAKKKPATPNG